VSAVLLPPPLGEGRGGNSPWSAEEPSAKYLTQLEPAIVRNFDLLATSPGGVAKLRELIFTLAVQGKLASQDRSDEPASVLLQKIQAEKNRMIAEGKIKPDKPMAKISEEEKPFDVPAGWEWARCSDYFLELCTGPFGSVIHQEDYIRGGVPLVNPSHMREGRIVHDPRVTLKQKDAERLSGYRLSTGDIVLARRGDVGRFALVTEHEHGWLCGTGSFFVRLHKTCNRQYLGLVFTDSRFRQHLQGESVGTTMTNLNQRILLDTLIAIPPLAEQSRIVARVEELMRLCDALEAKGKLEAAQHAQLLNTLLGTLTNSETSEALAENWQRVAAHFDLLLDRPEAVDALEQTILQLAVRGLLVPQDPAEEPASALLQKIRGEKDCLIAEGKIKRDKASLPIADEEVPFQLPEGWCWVRFDELTHPLKPIAYGVLVPGPDVPTGVPFVRIADLSLTNPSEKPEKAISPEVDANFQRTRVEGGEILMGVVGSIGKLGIAPSSWAGANIARAVCRIVPADNDLKGFVLFLLQTEFMQAGFAGDTRTLAQPTLNIGLIREALTPLPPPAEQSRIVARVDSLRRLCTDLRERLSASQATQAGLAESLVASTTA
jgi:type I restriction enzyme, S subunit